MVLQVIFGDDEHTASDGPYARLMKTRKWLYVSSGLAGILSLKLYNESRAGDFLRVVDLPSWLLSQVVLVGLFYLLVVYALLLRQLVSSYDIVLEDRLAYRRAGELAAAKETIKRLRDEFHRSYQERRASLESQTATTLAERTRETERKHMIQNHLRETASLDPVTRVQVEENLQGAERTIKEFDANLERMELDKAALNASPSVDDDPDILEAVASLDALRGKNPADRGWYKTSEVLIDIARLSAPALAGAGAAIALARTVLA